jgi:hypothetical protein
MLWAWLLYLDTQLATLVRASAPVSNLEHIARASVLPSTYSITLLRHCGKHK